MIGLEYILEVFHTNANQLASELSMSRYTIYDWIKERRKIPEKRVRQLAEHFKLPEDYFSRELTIEQMKVVEEAYITQKYKDNPDIQGELLNSVNRIDSIDQLHKETLYLYQELINSSMNGEISSEEFIDHSLRIFALFSLIKQNDHDKLKRIDQLFAELDDGNFF